jgi:hypothetical protein
VDRHEAFRIIESLRLGIPPDGAVRHFTVGRKEEIEDLRKRVQTGGAGLLYIKANYGSGKTHLLRLLREYALEHGYAVSLVSLDATASVRFNRMDQIVGAVMRGLVIPGSSETGVRCLFDLLCREIQKSRARGDTQGLWYRLTNRWKWNESDACESITMFVALRAWATGLPAVQELVEDWLFQPWSYYGQRRRIYQELIGNLGRYFHDGHQERYYYPDAFKLSVQAYDQSWKFLRDLRMLTAAAGLKGVVILFDEFENMLTGLKRYDYKNDAFWNLLQFGRQKQFPGLSAFAITPQFYKILGEFIQEMSFCNPDYSDLSQFPTFEMQPLDVNQLQELGTRIRDTHALALGWDATESLRDSELRAVVQESAKVPVQDRSRHTIKRVVSALDAAFEVVI